MKYAYISSQELIYKYDNTYLGFRVFQVQDTKDGLVDVDNILFWVDCADDVVANQFYYDPNTKEILSIPPAPPKPVNQPTTV